MPASSSTSTVSNNSPSPTSNNPPSMDNVNSPTTTSTTTSTITTPLTSTASSQASTTTTTTSTTAQQSSLNNTPTTTTTSITSSAAFPSSSQSQYHHQQSHHQQHQQQYQQQYHHQQQSLSNSISVADDHVKDYLHFRGFNETIRAFDKESRNDPSKIFSCEKIVEQLFFYLKQYEIIKCIEYWRYLEKKYFVYMLLSSSQDEYPHSQHSQHQSSVNDESSSSKINNNNNSSSSSSNNVNSSNQGNSGTSNGSSGSSGTTGSSSSSSSNNRDSLTTSSSTTTTNNSSNSSNSTSMNTSGGNHNQINFNSYSSSNNNSRHNGVCETVRKLEQSLKKFYVVNCVQMNRLDKIRDFFEEFGVELIRDDEEWKDWFILPFLKLSDVQNTKLEPYFHKNWLEMLYVSLYNFISTSLMRAERPMLLTLESDQRDRLTSLKRKVNMLMNENESLRSKLIAAEMYIAKLERDAGIQRDQIPANASPSDNDHVRHGRSSSIQQMATHSAVNQRTTSSGSGGGSSGSDDDGGNDDQDTRGDLTPVTNNSDMSGTGDSVSGSTLLPNTSADSNRGQQDVWEEGAALSGEVTNATPAVSQQRVSSPTSATSNSDMESQMLARRRSHRDLPQDYGRLKQLQPKKTLSGHKRFVTQCKFNSEGTAVATAALDRYTRVWSLSNSSCVAFDCGAPALSVEWIKKNESLLLSGSSNGRLRVCNTETGKFASETVTENMRYKNICDLASCPTNGNSCIVSCLNDEASATFKGIILGYNLKQMKVENRFSLEPDVAVSTVSFNHNGSMFVAAGNDGYIRVYDAKRADPIMKWKAHNGYVTSIQFSRNETTILSTGTDGRIVQWSAHHEGKILDEICPDFYVTGSDGVTSQFGSPNFIPKMSHMTDGNEMFAFSNPAVVYSMISKKPVYSFSTAVMSALDCHSHGHDEVKIVGADIDTFNVSLYSFIS